MILPCAVATIRQTEAAFAAAEEAGGLPTSPNGEHPDLLVLRFPGTATSTATHAETVRGAFAEVDTFTLHATEAEAFRLAPGLRLE